MSASGPKSGERSSLLGFSRRHPRPLDLLLQILQTGRVEVKAWEEYALHLEEATKLTHEKDAPILAATMLEDIDFLITRDKKAFLENEKLKDTPWQQKIHSPRGFLEYLTDKRNEK